MFPRPLVLVSLLVLLSLIILLSACGGNASASSATSTGTSATQPANAPTITLSANPTTITAGAFSNLSWTSTNAVSVVISPAIPAEDKQPLPLSSQGTPVVPTITTIYTATATSASGATATAQVTVNVSQLLPSVSCSAMPASIIAGQTSTLTCVVQNTTSLTIDNGVGAVPVPPGTAIVKPAVTTTYTATATGPGGTAPPATVTVSVLPPSQLGVTLTATPSLIASGQTSTLTWQSQMAASVTISPVIQGCAAAPCAVNLSGSATVGPAQTTTYTATATDAAGHIATASFIVNVIASNASLQNIKHIIFFLQENRSFDSYFGVLGQYKASKGVGFGGPCGMVNGVNTACGPNDVNGIPSNAVQYDTLKQAVHPYHYQTVCVENISPSWDPSWGAMDYNNWVAGPGVGLKCNGNGCVTGFSFSGGTPAMDGFVNDMDQPTTLDPQYHRVMGYYDQTDLPYYYEAAAQFATSDNWFSPVATATIPNRMYLFTGSSFGHIAPDPPPLGGWAQPTIFQLLNQHGVTWDYFYQDTSIMLGQWNVWGDQALINSHVLPISDWYTMLAGANADSALPQVVFIERAGETGLDEHPGSNTQSGAADAVNIINALLASPAWQDSVLIFTYDEFGGGYDHVPPMAGIPAPDNIQPMLPTNVASSISSISCAASTASVVTTTSVTGLTANSWVSIAGTAAYNGTYKLSSFTDGQHFSFAMASCPAPEVAGTAAQIMYAPYISGDFSHSGFRVPLVVFSPWVKPHFVSHVSRDLTSILKLIEVRFGLPALTFRDAWADDMTEFFDFTKPAWLTPPLLPVQPTNGVCDFTKELAGQN